MNLVAVDVQSLATIQTRSLGADKVWKQMGFEKILHEFGLTARKKTLANISIFGRLCEPRSEHNLYRWFQKGSALNELLDEDMSDVAKDGFYDIADELLVYEVPFFSCLCGYNLKIVLGVVEIFRLMIK
jgi:hypothetical protein